MTTRRAMVALTLSAAVAAASTLSAAETPRTFTFTTKSDAARAKLREVQDRVESFQGGAPAAAMVREILELDPEFAMAMYYLSATTPPPDNQKHLDRAVELSKKASEGERRFIEAMVLARGKTPADAVEPLRKLAADYPGERVLFMLLGQNLAGLGRHDEARAAYEQAIRISDRTPRAYSLLGNYHLLKGDYAKAREYYTIARGKMPKGVAPGATSYGIAFTHLYEGDVEQALKILTAFVDDYRNATVRFGELPEVFIWNSIARVNLENGRLEDAMKAYEKGFETVPGSKLSEDDKKIWLGRLHHGRGRTLARMGKHAEAWKEAETIKQMIAEGGERGKQFEEAYQYLAGYLKLEAGETAAAIEHLTRADLDDPFQKLLLARAYEKAGKKEDAKKLYAEIVNFPNSNLERALAYREAKKRLATL
jgi:tetratricopeptide (TPR) repeat protein